MAVSLTLKQPTEQNLGGGGSPTMGWSKLSFLLFLIEGTSATRYFLPDQKILILAKVLNVEYMGNYTTRGYLNRRS